MSDVGHADVGRGTQECGVFQAHLCYSGLEGAVVVKVAPAELALACGYLGDLQHDAASLPKVHKASQGQRAIWRLELVNAVRVDRYPHHVPFKLRLTPRL